jgi:predicted peptidase
VEVVVSVPGYSGNIRSTKAVEKVIGEFAQYQYENIPYSLYIPKNRMESEKYPVVMFIPDAAANGSDPKLALAQGIGATVWAEESWQKDHPCFVLAIQVPREVRLANDDFSTAPELETIKKILDQVIEEYPVDRNRVYVTGQSQGCMASCELNVRYPDFFAASMLVSGQWDPQTVGALTDARFFIGIDDGGMREFPGMNAITEALEQNGVSVSRVHLNFRDGWAVNNEKVHAAADGRQVVYAMFDADTAFPDDGWERPRMMHHNRGWELTYQLESAREWLFAQYRQENK